MSMKRKKPVASKKKKKEEENSEEEDEEEEEKETKKKPVKKAIKKTNAKGKKGGGGDQEEKLTPIVDDLNDTSPVPGADQLEQLLSMDPTLIPSKEAFESTFKNIAEQLMNSYALQINGRTHRLTELEFYFCGDKHNDIFTHQDELQQSSAKWYFHKTGSGYKGGSYKGLDITFGQLGYGGILIRSIQSVEDSEYIEGPCNCVNRILELNAVKEIAAYVETQKFSLDVSRRGTLYLRKYDFPIKDVYGNPRFGLNLKAKPRPQTLYYLMKNYRYVCFPDKVRKGRVNLVLGLLAIGKNQQEIRTITGCTAAVISKYKKIFDEGKKLQVKEAKSYFGKLNTDRFCTLSGILVSGMPNIDPDGAADDDEEEEDDDVKEKDDAPSGTDDD